jgi:hypothetical protein
MLSLLTSAEAMHTPSLPGLIAFISDLVDDANLKVVLSSLQVPYLPVPLTAQMLGVVVAKAAPALRPQAAPLASRLLPLLGDSKIVVRQAVTKVSASYSH